MLLQHKMDGGLLVNDASTSYNNANKHKQLQIFQERLRFVGVKYAFP